MFNFAEGREGEGRENKRAYVQEKKMNEDYFGTKMSGLKFQLCNLLGIKKKSNSMIAFNCII